MKSSGAKDFWSLLTILNRRRAFRCNVRDSGADCNTPAKLWIQIDYELPLTYNKVEVGGNQQLASLVEITGIEAQTIKELNPVATKFYSTGRKSLSHQVAGRQWCDRGTAATEGEAT
jgi:hypothetical protein